MGVLLGVSSEKAAVRSQRKRRVPIDIAPE